MRKLFFFVALVFALLFSYGCAKPFSLKDACSGKPVGSRAGDKVNLCLGTVVPSIEKADQICDENPTALVQLSNGSRVTCNGAFEYQDATLAPSEPTIRPSTIDNPNMTSSDQSPSERSDEWQIYGITEKIIDSKIIETSEINARNCGGINDLEVTESVSYRTKQEISLGSSVGLEGNTGLDLGVVAELKVSLEARYDITNGNEIEKTNSFNIRAAPNQNVKYPVYWKLVVAKGEIVLKNGNGEFKKIPYNVGLSLRADLGDAIILSCN